MKQKELEILIENKVREILKENLDPKEITKILNVMLISNVGKDSEWVPWVKELHTELTSILKSNPELFKTSDMINLLNRLKEDYNRWIKVYKEFETAQNTYNIETKANAFKLKKIIANK
jgi:hypothetical protein